MKPSAVCTFVVAALLWGCAPEETTTAGFDFRMSGITRDQVGQVQVTIISDAKSLLGDPQLGQRCIKDLVTDRSRFVLMEGGKTSVLIDATATEAQTISGITVGSDYLFVGEAISKDTQQLIGHGRLVGAIKAGELTRLPLEIRGTTDGGVLADCNPTL